MTRETCEHRPSNAILGAPSIADSRSCPARAPFETPQVLCSHHRFPPSVADYEPQKFNSRAKESPSFELWGGIGASFTPNKCLTYGVKHGAIEYMKQMVSAKLTLHTTPEQFQALRQAQLAYRDALNHVSRYAFAHHKMSNQRALQKQTYEDIRAMYGLPEAPGV